MSDKSSWKRILRKGSQHIESDADYQQSPATKLIFEQDERIYTPASPYRRYRSTKLLKKIGALTKSEDGQIQINKNVEVALGKFIDFVVIKES
ncbi:hypothetical protein QNF07_004483 [Vibrio alginolyticus]|nr:hypothetical protein [Vibrio alginolyticus]